jgi:soluble lytic murein transglycosylase-like protein
MRKYLQLGLLIVLAAMQLPAAEMANLRNGFSIRHERHETLGEMTRLYQGDQTDSGYVDVSTAEIVGFEAAPPPEEASAVAAANGSQDLSKIIGDASARSRIDADFIASVIRAESGNNPHAVSRKGAKGLMQLMPATASNLGVTNSFDASQNVDGGVRYLRELLLRYNGDAAKALAAYNAGPKRVQQYGGVPPYRETHAYVARVITDYNRKKLAEARRQSQAAQADQTSVRHDGSARGASSGGK